MKKHFKFIVAVVSLLLFLGIAEHFSQSNNNELSIVQRSLNFFSNKFSCFAGTYYREPSIDTLFIGFALEVIDDKSVAIYLFFKGEANEVKPNLTQSATYIKNGEKIVLLTDSVFGIDIGTTEIATIELIDCNTLRYIESPTKKYIMTKI